MVDRVLDFLSRRRQSYARKFDIASNDLSASDAQVILNDLMRFCRGGESLFHPDRRMTDVLIGRQEVLHRIIDYARLDPAVLYEKYNSDRFKPRREGNTNG